MFGGRNAIFHQGIYTLQILFNTILYVTNILSPKTTLYKYFHEEDYPRQSSLEHQSIPTSCTSKKSRNKLQQVKGLFSIKHEVHSTSFSSHLGSFLDGFRGWRSRWLFPVSAGSNVNISNGVYESFVLSTSHFCRDHIYAAVKEFSIIMEVHYFKLYFITTEQKFHNNKKYLILRLFSMMATWKQTALAMQQLRDWPLLFISTVRRQRWNILGKQVT